METKEKKDKFPTPENNNTQVDMGAIQEIIKDYRQMRVELNSIKEKNKLLEKNNLELKEVWNNTKVEAEKIIPDWKKAKDCSLLVDYVLKTPYIKHRLKNKHE